MEKQNFDVLTFESNSYYSQKASPFTTPVSDGEFPLPDLGGKIWRRGLLDQRHAHAQQNGVQPSATQLGCTSAVVRRRITSKRRKDDVEAQATEGAVKQRRLNPLQAVENGVQPSVTPTTPNIAVKQEPLGDLRPSQETETPARANDAQQQTVSHMSVHEQSACVDLLRQHIEIYSKCASVQVFLEDLPRDLRAFVSL